MDTRKKTTKTFEQWLLNIVNRLKILTIETSVPAIAHIETNRLYCISVVQ